MRNSWISHWLSSLSTVGTVSRFHFDRYQEPTSQECVARWHQS